MGKSTGGATPRLLVVRVGAMGDVLHALPAIAALRADIRNVWLGWAIEPRWAVLLRAEPDSMPRSANMPLVDVVHAVPTRQWSKHPFSAATWRSVLALRKELRRERYDVALDLQGSLRSAVIARMSGARRVIGPATPREWPARWFYTDRVTTAATHVVDQAAELARAAALALGGRGDWPIADTPLPQDAEAERWAALVQKAGESIGPEERGSVPLVLLAPTAGWGAKQWPAKRFGTLAAELVKRGCRVLVNATPPLPDAVGQQVLGAALAELSPERQKHIELVDATLPRLAALLRRCSLLVAGDTGPLHLAAALGTPVLALFGPTDPARTGPYAANAIVLRNPNSVTDHRRHAETEPGLASIGVDTVLEGAVKLLGLPQ